LEEDGAGYAGGQAGEEVEIGMCPSLGSTRDTVGGAIGHDPVGRAGILCTGYMWREDVRLQEEVEKRVCLSWYKTSSWHRHGYKGELSNAHGRA
jgi:hypothetical protein